MILSVKYYLCRLFYYFTQFVAHFLFALFSSTHAHLFFSLAISPLRVENAPTDVSIFEFPLVRKRVSLEKRVKRRKQESKLRKENPRVVQWSTQCCHMPVVDSQEQLTIPKESTRPPKQLLNSGRDLCFVNYWINYNYGTARMTMADRKRKFLNNLNLSNNTATTYFSKIFKNVLRKVFFVITNL